MKVVVDANVCVSAVLSSKGNPARVLDHVLQEGPHDFELCAPSQYFIKIQEVLARPKIADRLGWSPAEISIRLLKDDLERIRRRAAKAGVGYTTLIRMILRAHLDDPLIR